ncbi:unnamed protein product [Phaedon cochleariae]|uniref:Gamma-interferon-inducible lysosomal thiol reductase n=1 Tax=Phaedon cochleariae TaxID=80249 RepID=A0A9N9SHX6_PHACE|nr:unnamed protein product [Phaedon cochleariae]
MWKVLGFFLVLACASQAERLKVSVYYESLCGDSIRFVKNQLFPVYKLLGNALQVDLVPYGKASSSNESGKLVFTCQHGPQECYGNKFHACAISQNSVEESTEFVYCSLSSTEESPASDETLERCSNSSGISWKALQSCYESGRADALLIKNGERTSAITPPLKFVPTIIFNDHFDQTNQDRSLRDLLSVVCELLNQHKELNGEYKFSCQHGPSECLANKYQSCVLALNYGQQKNVLFVDCIMRKRSAADFNNVQSCAELLNLNTAKIKACSESSEGDRLLARNGDLTWQLDPQISFVPTIVYDQKYNSDAQSQSLQDFVAVVCSKIEGNKPEICKDRKLPQTNGWGWFG